MDFGAVFTATALSAVVATLIMALYANLPFALAPGMGLNAFFAYTVVLTMGYSWQMALTAVFVEGSHLHRPDLPECAGSHRELHSHEHQIRHFRYYRTLHRLYRLKNSPVSSLTALQPLRQWNTASPAALVALFGVVVTGWDAGKRM